MEQPCRKSPRLPGYDYSAPGTYFVTICTANRKKTLSRISVGAIHESPVTVLTPYGQVVDDVIACLPERFGIEVDRYVIMPNHIHLLLRIPEETARAIHESPLRKRDLLPQIVGYLKMNASKQIHAKTATTQPLFQRSYHDHIIRGDADYDKIARYIAENPARWQQDCFYEP